MPAGSAHYDTPLPRKLGINEGSTVALVSAPDDFERTLGALPPEVTLRHGNRGARDITIGFTTSRNDLERRFDALARAVGEGTLWVAWPKKSSDMPSDLTQLVVIEAGLRRELVDSKNCAIDETWSGLRFTRRRR
jgi:hypothetical protein